MSDVELVIKIPEQIYVAIRKTDVIISDQRNGKSLMGKSLMSIILNAIANGAPLPKGHGRILDEKDILDIENNDGGWYDLVDMPEYIAGVKAIIEADKTEIEDKNE